MTSVGADDAIALPLAFSGQRLDWRDLPRLTGAFAGAYAIGFLSLLTPSGLGVREGVLVFLLSGAYPAALVTVVALQSGASSRADSSRSSATGGFAFVAETALPVRSRSQTKSSRPSMANRSLLRNGATSEKGSSSVATSALTRSRRCLPIVRKAASSRTWANTRSSHLQEHTLR